MTNTPSGDSAERGPDNGYQENTPSDLPSDASGMVTPPTLDSGDANVQPYLAEPILTPRIRPRIPVAPLGTERSLFDQLWLPVFLLSATCLSTFFAGAMSWQNGWVLEAFVSGKLGPSETMLIRQEILRHSNDGLVYMVCVVGILFAHEMGHYIATRYYKVPASFPFFIPFPFAPIGTMGAVIAMQNQKANRKEIFDIGIAGPLAGLVLAIPITGLGVAQLEVLGSSAGGMAFDMPLLIRWMHDWIHPDQNPLPSQLIASQLNPMLMAGWVGLLITGLNMLPVSQLDGGHVTYTLFGKHSRTIARVFIGIAIVYMVWNNVLVWTVMLVLIFAMGIYHPPTSDDEIPLGIFRVTLGCISLLIPVLCFPPRGLGFL